MRLALADTTSAMLLHETNILPVAYFPIGDVDFSRLVATNHTTHCPYKGDAAPWDYAGDDGSGPPIGDMAWSYQFPFDESLPVGGYWSFLGDEVEPTVRR